MITPANIQIRFADCDMMGHVNNGIYLSYFESARMHYFAQLLGIKWDWNKNGVILRKNEIEYLKPLYIHEKPMIKLFTEHIGEKSFTLSYELWSGEELKTIGKSVLVCYDATANKSIEIPHEMKLALETIKK
jgi:acyl-CoA thioester hydrolase